MQLSIFLLYSWDLVLPHISILPLKWLDLHVLPEEKYEVHPSFWHSRGWSYHQLQRMGLDS